MQPTYGVVSGPNWDSVLLVGGGPSAQEFDFNSLPAHVHILAVNDAWFTVLRRRLPHRTPSVFSLDHRWIRRWRLLLSTYIGEKYIALHLETWPDCGGIPGAVYLRWGSCRALSDDPGIIHTGCNSGYGALNVAYLKHARKIYLIGYDMDPSDREYYANWAQIFHTAVPQLQAADVTVVNLNPDSYIDAFPRLALTAQSVGVESYVEC